MHLVADSLSYIDQACAGTRKIYDAHCHYIMRSVTSRDACASLNFKRSPVYFVLLAFVDVSAAQSAPRRSFRAGQVGASRERLGGHNLVGGCDPAQQGASPCSLSHVAVRTHTHTFSGAGKLLLQRQERRTRDASPLPSWTRRRVISHRTK